MARERWGREGQSNAGDRIANCHCLPTLRTKLLQWKEQGDLGVLKNMCFGKQPVVNDQN